MSDTKQFYVGEEIWYVTNGGRVRRGMVDDILKEGYQICRLVRTKGWITTRKEFKYCFNTRLNALEAAAEMLERGEHKLDDEKLLVRLEEIKEELEQIRNDEKHD